MALTDKQEMFCREYLIDLNATQAAIRAGYSAKTANRTASENLSKPDIQSRIAELKAQRNDLVGINAIYVLNRLVEIDQKRGRRTARRGSQFEVVKRLGRRRKSVQQS